MYNIKNLIKQNLPTMILSMIAIMFITGCQSGGGSGGSSSTPNPETPVALLPVAGALQLSSFDKSNILSNGAGAPATATISLVGSANVSNLPVNFTSSENSVIISPPSCVLSTESSSCTITVTGESVSPSVTIIANAGSNYTSVTSTPLNVYTQIKPTLTNPAGSDAGYSINGEQVSFSGVINPASVSTSTFIVSSSLPSINGLPGTFITDSGESIVTFKPAAALATDSTYYLEVTNGITDQYGQPVAAISSSFKTQQFLLIYLATNNGIGWNGNLLAAGQQVNESVTTGIHGADALCQADTRCPTGGTCKAILVDDNATRQAYPTAIDWVLQSSKPYMNESGQYLGNTTSAAIFTSLANPINADANISAWTGIFDNTNWITLNGNNCNSWGSDSSTHMGQTGNPNYSSAVFIANTTFDCTSPKGLYCAQQ